MLGATARVQAQPQEARTAFERGVAAIEAGRYADGVALLERSLELLPRASTAFNLAVARRGTGDFVGARNALRSILDGRYGDIDARAQQRAEQLLVEAESEVGRLVLVIDGGRHIRVTVDGQGVGTLTEPGRLELEVNPGVRRLGVVAVDRVPVEQEVTVQAGDTAELELRLRARLDDRPGRLQLISTDPEAQVEIVGHGTGRGRLDAELPAGAYTVRVVSSNGQREDQVLIPPGRLTRFELSPAQGQDDAWIWVVVTTVGAAALAAGAWLGWELYEPGPVPSDNWPTVRL